MKQMPFGRPRLGEEEFEAVRQVLESGILVHGKRVDEFEATFSAYTGAPHAVAVGSCTAGMHLLYFHLGLGAGDEVIVPAQTHAATAHAVELTGARAVFVDAEPGTGNIDARKIGPALTERTKAICVVHYLGLPVDMAAVLEIAGKRGLFVVEDCALAVGAQYEGTHVGLQGDAGCFSFYPVKHLTTAEGGMVITRHHDVAVAVSHSRAFGMDRHMGQRKLPGHYDVQGLGFNYRMGEIEAALGLAQMKRLPGFLCQRAENFAALAAGLESCDAINILPEPRPGRANSHYCVVALLRDDLADRRDFVVAQLKERGVGTSIYYPRPVPLMTYYRDKYGYRQGEFPVAERISGHGIALPVGPHLTPDDMGVIAEALIEAIHEAAA